MKTASEPRLKLDGRSGCAVEIWNDGRMFRVRKVSRDFAYNDRLMLQAAKQQSFQSEGYFQTPQVLDRHQGSSSDLAWFDMHYVYGEKYSDYLLRASVGELAEAARKFSAYFDNAFMQSRETPADHDAIRLKLRQLSGLLRNDASPATDTSVTGKALAYLERIPEASILTGPCHGDFTFSNMIFLEKKICLIDFLDSFIDSPIIDLVKFRQDTKFYWTSFIDREVPSHHATKIFQVFDFLDATIEKHVAGNEFVSRWYNYLQVFNLLRILPYVSRRSEIEFVQRNISTLL